MGTFVFRWPHPANDVHVTGTFDDWGKTEKLEKVGDVFEKEVTLPSADEKYYYKFVVDDVWITDHEAPQEGDGHWNMNNVLFPEHIKRLPVAEPTKEVRPEPTAEAPSEPAKDVSSEPTVAAPSEPAKDVSAEPSHTGAEVGAAAATGGLLAGGATAALLSSAHPESTTAHLAAAVPKEGAPVGDELEPKISPPGAFPVTPLGEPQEFSVKPIPESSGIANPISVPAGEKLPETVAPASEPHEFSVAPIPASAGIGNPISVPAGEKLPDHSTLTPHTVQSTVTTSKEDYEKDASAALLGAGAAAGVAGAGALAEKKATTDSAFSVPEKSTNMIPESSLPLGGAEKDTVDTGPTISSAHPQSTSAYLAATVPLEPKRKAYVEEEDEAPSATLSGPAPTVPEPVKESIAESHQSPEAAAVPEVVEEKKAVESELLKTVEPTDAVGEPAPTTTAAVSETAPAPTKHEGIGAGEAGAVAAGTAAVGATVAAGATAASKSKPEPPAKDVKPAAAATPTKSKPTPPTSAPSTPGSGVTKEEKKKNRRSFFGKLKDKLKDL